MIPKVIHYCWFGGNPLPALVRLCIDSWRHYMPDYKIVRWDETNFDVNQIPYTSEAYKAKKWAYVSDYARMKVLYDSGGVYLDTDVELIKSLEPIIEKGAFMACERHSNFAPYPGVATGLGIATDAHNPLYKEILDYYENIHFCGASTGLTVVEHVTSVLIRRGLMPTSEFQTLDGVNIYPPDFFCPFDEMNRISITSNTVAIHHYAGSWLGKSEKMKKKIVHLLGPRITFFILRIKACLRERIH